MGIKQFLRYLTAALPAAVLPVHTAHSLDLSQYRWKNRILVLFAPAPSDGPYRDFDNSLTRNSRDVLERCLVVIRVFETGAATLDGEALEPEEATNLRARFSPAPQRFTLILIGKDGGVKLRREHRANLQDIFALIDSMPMRQAEMQRSRSC